jgi:glutamate-1-semialdehyde 2,1-aminomutase
MNGCYHGHSDCLLVAAGSGLAEHSTPSSRRTAELSEKTIVADYNDIPAAERVFEEYHGRVAGLIIDRSRRTWAWSFPTPDN